MREYKVILKNGKSYILEFENNVHMMKDIANFCEDYDIKEVYDENNNMIICN